MTNDAVLLGAKRLDRPLRSEIEVVGAETDDLASQGVERVTEEEQFAGGVHVGALNALRVPGIADLDAIGGGDDVVISRRSDNRVPLQIGRASCRERVSTIV